MGGDNWNYWLGSFISRYSHTLLVKDLFCTWRIQLLDITFSPLGARARQKSNRQISLYTWADAFQTFDWEKALPDPAVATKQVEQLLALV